MLLSSKPTTPGLAVNIRFGMHINENLEPVLSLVPRSIGLRIARFVETSNADTTPIQCQISCNIQNDNKTCVNTNIYSI